MNSSTHTEQVSADSDHVEIAPDIDALVLQTAQRFYDVNLDPHNIVMSFLKQMQSDAKGNARLLNDFLKDNVPSMIERKIIDSNYWAELRLKFSQLARSNREELYVKSREGYSQYRS